MNEVVVTNDMQMPEVKTWNGQRVVTLKDIDVAHGRAIGTSRRNFNRNKKHFIIGEDYIVRNSYEARNEYNISAPNGLTLLTESGYLMIVKSFTDDLSWDVQRRLVNSYFKQQVHKTAPICSKNTNPLPPKRDKWYHRNIEKIAAVCKYRDNAPIKEFYHQFLIRLNTNGYDVDELNDIFFKERGRMPQHTGELIEHFSEMEREADEYLQYLWSRTPKWSEINSKS